MVKSVANTQVENNVNSFKNITLSHAKRQPPNLKRILANSLFTNETASVFAVNNFYWISHIGLKKLINNSF